MPSNTPSPYRRPWSHTETTALPRSYHVPSIHTMEGMSGNLPRLPSGQQGLDEAAGDRTQDLRIKSPLLYQLSYRLNNNPVKGNTVKKKGVKRRASKSKPSKWPFVREIDHTPMPCRHHSHGDGPSRKPQDPSRDAGGAKPRQRVRHARQGVPRTGRIRAGRP